MKSKSASVFPLSGSRLFWHLPRACPGPLSGGLDPPVPLGGIRLKVMLWCLGGPAVGADYLSGLGDPVVPFAGLDPGGQSVASGEGCSAGITVLSEAPCPRLHCLPQDPVS